MKRRAVSIVELAIGIALLVIMASQMSLNTDIYSQTSKREAEKLAKKLSSLMLEADKTKTYFQIEIYTDKMRVQWNTNETSINTQADRDVFTEDFTASSGCSYTWNASNKVIYYSHLTNRFSQGATITINGRGDPYYVVIATIGSRIRVSDTKP